MTKVARLLEEEIREEVREAVREEVWTQAIRNERVQMAKEMLADGKDTAEILRYSKLSPEELTAVQMAVIV